MRNNPETEPIMLADDDRSEADHYPSIDSEPEPPMQEVTLGPADHCDPQDRIAIISDQLVKAFGPDACVVVERQIEAAGDGDEAATWNAIWDHLCGPQARRA